MWCAVDHILKRCECHCVICMCLLVSACVCVCDDVLLHTCVHKCWGRTSPLFCLCMCVCADVKQASCGTMFRLDLQHLDSSPHELSHCQSLPLAY